MKFATDDVRGRLRAGDLLLMSQDVSPAAEISIVKCGQDLLLARLLEKNSLWEDVATGNVLPTADAIVGHCVAILWGLLFKASEAPPLSHS